VPKHGDVNIFQHHKFIDNKSLQNRLLKVCYVPATSAGLPRLLFLLWPLTVLKEQTRQVVRAVKQSMLLTCLYLSCINWGADLFSFKNEPKVVYDSADVCAKSILINFSAATEQDGLPLPGDIL
jgi:hypothetical protein